MGTVWVMFVFLNLFPMSKRAVGGNESSEKDLPIGTNLIAVAQFVWLQHLKECLKIQNWDGKKSTN